MGGVRAETVWLLARASENDKQCAASAAVVIERNDLPQRRQIPCGGGE